MIDGGGSVARREPRLVVACARTRIDDEQAARIRALAAEDVDWKRVFDIAAAHGVVPLLYRSLRSACADAVPPPALEYLRSQYRGHCRQSFVGAGQLLKLLALFQAEGIAVMPIKGPVLAGLAYGDIILRQFGDLDILLARRDLARARRLLAERGYRPDEYEAASLDAENVNALGFAGSGVDLPVELHWVLLPRHLAVPFDLERLRRRLIRVSLMGRTVPTLSLEDTLLFLVAHGAKHEWERLMWVCDVAELLARHHGAIDWDRLLAEAHSGGQLRLLHLGILLAADLLGARAPEVEPRARADRGAVALRDRVAARFFERTDAAAHASGGHSHTEEHLAGLVFIWHARERWRDRARILLRAALAIGPDDRKIVRLPPRLARLYHAVRLARTARSLARVARRRFGHPRRPGPAARQSAFGSLRRRRSSVSFTTCSSASGVSASMRRLMFVWWRRR